MSALSANEQLMGAEAEARAKYEACVAGTCDCLTHGAPGNSGIVYSYQHGFIEADGITIYVGYHGDPIPGVREQWTYQFIRGEREGSDLYLRGKFDSRYSCLLALKARLEVRS